ncbi:GTP-binding protein [Cribrihabitans sp. XS_ASV171]
MTDERVPVTLLTGFLGAGKTTLLNAVLGGSTARRIAVIVNEFDETGLDHDLAVSQLAMADLVVLSKTDLVPPEQVALFEERLWTINPGVRILYAVRGDGAPGRIWGLSGLREDAVSTDVLAWTRAPERAHDPLANLSGLARHTPEAFAPSPHDTRIGTASIILDDPIPDVAFDIWLDTLIALRGPDILRVKGIVFLEGIETPFVFHGLQEVFDPPVPLRIWPGGDRRSRIVVIARDISRPELLRSLDILRARPKRPATPTQFNEVPIA